jgi:hypothetical protein
MWAVKPFTVPGQGDIWYPWLNGLARGASTSLRGSLSIGIPHGTDPHGKRITIIPLVDSCSGDEFMPDYCRARERNENSNVMQKDVSLP